VWQSAKILEEWDKYDENGKMHRDDSDGGIK